jgi:hypothetical protein
MILLLRALLSADFLKISRLFAYTVTLLDALFDATPLTLCHTLFDSKRTYLSNISLRFRLYSATTVINGFGLAGGA